MVKCILISYVPARTRILQTLPFFRRFHALWSAVKVSKGCGISSECYESIKRILHITSLFDPKGWMFPPLLDELTFTCERRCNKKRSCGRHKCGEMCCVVGHLWNNSFWKHVTAISADSFFLFCLQIRTLSINAQLSVATSSTVVFTGVRRCVTMETANPAGNPVSI